VSKKPQPCKGVPGCKLPEIVVRGQSFTCPECEYRWQAVRLDVDQMIWMPIGYEKEEAK
jgi:hypothetical protein